MKTGPKIEKSFHELYPNATYTISYLDSKNGFRQTEKVFMGANGGEQAEAWGRANLPNFHPDMVNLKLN